MRAGLMMVLVAFGAPVWAAPVVLELFTSQGCSSCPPAEALLEDLARTHPEVVPLAYHVDYWDDLGWKDPLASPANTALQRSYAAHGNGRVFTPELRVNGHISLVGSDRAGVARAMPMVPVPLALQVASTAQGWAATMPAALRGQRAQLRLLRVQQLAANAVPRGENAGRTLSGRHAVVAHIALPDWDGETPQVALPLLPLAPNPAESETRVLLVQAPHYGRILAVGVF